MKFATFVAALAAVFVVTAAPAHAEAKTTKSDRTYVTVKAGDSLSKIAKKHHTTYKRIYDANKKVKNPNLIYPGQKLRIPEKKEKLKSRSVPVAPAPVAYSYAAPVTSSYRAPAQTAPRVASGSVWDQLAACESGGNWAINTGNGFYGGLQFTVSSWHAAGGSGMPQNASRTEQIRVAKNLQAMQGWGAWPACAAKLGLL